MAVNHQPVALHESNCRMVWDGQHSGCSTGSQAEVRVYRVAAKVHGCLLHAALWPSLAVHVALHCSEISCPCQSSMPGRPSARGTGCGGLQCRSPLLHLGLLPGPTPPRAAGGALQQRVLETTEAPSCTARHGMRQHGPERHRPAWLHPVADVCSLNVTSCAHLRTRAPPAWAAGCAPAAWEPGRGLGSCQGGQAGDGRLVSLPSETQMSRPAVKQLWAAVALASHRGLPRRQ